MLKKIYVALGSVIAAAMIMVGISGLVGARQQEAEAASRAQAEALMADAAADAENKGSNDESYYDGLVKLQRAYEVEERTMRTAVSNVQEQEAPILSEGDYEALVRIVEAEATDEDIIGKIMVANVVLNRVESSRFPDSIYEVVHQKTNGKVQFSPISDGRYYSVTVTASTIEAVERALKGEDHANGALFFMFRAKSAANNVTWFDTHLTKVAEHGCHEFFKY